MDIKECLEENEDPSVTNKPGDEQDSATIRHMTKLLSYQIAIAIISVLLLASILIIIKLCWCKTRRAPAARCMCNVILYKHFITMITKYEWSTYNYKVTLK